MSLGRTTQYPPTLPLALNEHVRWLHIQDRNTEASALAREALAIAERFQLKPHIASASIQLGRSMVLDGSIDTGDQMMRKGVELWLKSWSTLGGTWILTEPAWTMAAVGHLSSVEHYLSIGERVLRDTEERVGEAELLRLRAWVYRAKRDHDSAVAILNNALAVAEKQGARYFALLAALDLVETADHPDSKRIALEALKRVYQGFSEGFQFRILMSARKLIEAQ